MNKFTSSGFLGILLWFVLGLCVTSCSTLSNHLEPTHIVLVPDTPLLIQEVAKDKLLVSVYNVETNQLIEYGWITIESLRGRTISTFDWTTYKANRTKRDNE